MHEALEALPEKEKENLVRQDFPDWINPMLATLTDKHFSDKKWIYKRKYQSNHENPATYHNDLE